MKFFSLQKKKAFKTSAGFTLVELMVSLSIFVIVMTIVMGAVLSVVNVNSLAQSKKTAMDNLNFAIESMSRTIRFGTSYHCDVVGTLSTPRDCSAGANSLTLRAVDGSLVTYSLSAGALTRSINGGTALALTSPEVTIQNLSFRVFGSYAYGVDYLQPQVILTISGLAGTANKVKTQALFKMQTTVSQRQLDI